MVSAQQSNSWPQFDGLKKQSKVKAPYTENFRPLITGDRELPSSDLKSTMIDELSLAREPNVLADQAIRFSEENNTKIVSDQTLPGGTSDDGVVKGSDLLLDGEEVSPEKFENEKTSAEVLSVVVEQMAKSFDQLEAKVIDAIEARLGKALYSIFQQSLVDEANDSLNASIKKIIGQRDGVTLKVTGPQIWIDRFKQQIVDQETLILEVSVSAESTDIIVQIDDLSIMTRIGEADFLLGDLFQC